SSTSTPPRSRSARAAGRSRRSSRGRTSSPSRAATRQRQCPVAEELVRVGRVGKPHGLDGSFFVEQASEDEERFAKGAILRVDGDAATVVASKRSGGRPVIRLDREVSRGAELSIPRSELPQTAENEYYAFQLVGLNVDDEPYGGGAGMVLRVDVVAAAVEAVYGGDPGRRVVALTPQGRQLTQAVVEELAGEERLTLLSARFEGFDERVLIHLASDAIS